LQGPHGFDRSVAVSPTPLVIEALHVLQSEFTSRYVGANLLDDTVMIDQGFCYRAIERRYRRRISRAAHFRQPLFKVRCNSALGSGFGFSAIAYFRQREDHR